VPASVRAHLEAGVRGEITETPKPGSPVFAHAQTKVIATAHQSLEAAAAVFRAAGITPVILGDTVTGEAREAAKVHAAIAREIAQYGAPFKPPLALISGGECTVTVKNPQGRGGRCSEYLLSMAIELGGMAHAWGLAADTDGIDGSEPNAGALFGPDILARAAAAGLRADKLLEANDAYGFFQAADALVITGPTRTNVNDYRALLLAGERP
jgi:hydroxypyruvate reductase